MQNSVQKSQYNAFQRTTLITPTEMHQHCYICCSLFMCHSFIKCAKYVQTKPTNPTFCRTLRSTCTSDNSGRIPGSPLRDVAALRNLLLVPNISNLSGCLTPSLSMKKQPTFMMLQLIISS